jgi:hypothetical protein
VAALKVQAARKSRLSLPNICEAHLEGCLLEYAVELLPEVFHVIAELHNGYDLLPRLATSGFS